MAWKPMTVKDTLTPGLAGFFKKAGVGKKNDSGTGDFKARQKLGLALLSFVLNGSSKEGVVPPIQWGVLRGSGSVFVDGVLVGDTKASYPDGTPNREYSDQASGQVTVGFNTAYAAHLHETTWVPGGRRPSRQSVSNPGMLGDVGNKFVEKHLRADGEVLLRMYADVFRKEMGT